METPFSHSAFVGGDNRTVPLSPVVSYAVIGHRQGCTGCVVVEEQGICTCLQLGQGTAGVDIAVGCFASG